MSKPTLKERIEKFQRSQIFVRFDEAYPTGNITFCPKEIKEALEIISQLQSIIEVQREGFKAAKNQIRLERRKENLSVNAFGRLECIIFDFDEKTTQMMESNDD